MSRMSTACEAKHGFLGCGPRMVVARLSVAMWEVGEGLAAMLRPQLPHLYGPSCVRRGPQATCSGEVLTSAWQLKGICPRGNNKVVIILFRVHNRCLFLMLELY
jgi:hypothetical protein